MNTQRPEWNDANNALVGFGLSMVTLYYLRRYLSFLLKLLKKTNSYEFNISTEVKDLFDDINSILEQNKDILTKGIDDVLRKKILDQLGKASEKYRIRVYNGFSGCKVKISKDGLKPFLTLALQFIDSTIKNNKREDGLYHSYNLIHFGNQGHQVEHLYEMLEGQVAVLSSGFLSLKENLHLLAALRNSKIYRKDQNSYMLYPDKELPRFLEKNIIPDVAVNQVEWLQEQIKKKDRQVIEQDINGQHHFNGSYRNSAELRNKLQKDATITYEEIDAICKLFEEQFNHRQFTGRSGTFYKYEGLGCIYWHMVSKLLLAVQDLLCNAIKSPQKEEGLSEIYQQYKEIQEGIGIHKTPAEYGAFPIDPYSHTPSFAGAQQPGMTGQVKEDLIVRQYELGVHISDGIVQFKPTLLTKGEFFSQETLWKCPSESSTEPIVLPKKSLGFTLCSVPVIYQLSSYFQILVEMKNNKTHTINNNALDMELSRSIFKREGKINKITVHIPREEIEALAIE